MRFEFVFVGCVAVITLLLVGYTSWLSYNYLGLVYHSCSTYYGYYNEIGLLGQLVPLGMGFLVGFFFYKLRGMWLD